MSFNNCCRVIVGILAGLILGGCSTTQSKETRRYFWPPLPERPRIEWLKSYSNDKDFGTSGMQSFLDNVVGEDLSVSLERPLDIAVNSKKQVIVVDAGLRNVVIFDFPAKSVSLLWRKGDTSEDFEQPVSLAVDDKDNIYVADQGKKKIFVFDEKWKSRFIFDVRPNLVGVGGVAFDPVNRRLAVADTHGHKIGFFDMQGKFLSSFGERGETDGKLNYPNPLKYDRKNQLVVGDTMNARIQVFDANGKFIRKIGNRGDAPQDFQILKGIGIDSDNNYYVSDGKGHKLVIFNEEGDYLLTLGGLFSALVSGKEGVGGFVLPQGVFVDKSDKIYVVDQLNSRFQVFQYISDKFLKENPIPGYVEIKELKQ